ncbi:hypothetical protein FRC08_004829, partial [Ceratobasidium sp. 394]
VFSHYYGFLCVRYTLHIICLNILAETKTLDGLLGSLDSDISCDKLTWATAVEASEVVRRASTTTESLEEFYRIFSRPSFSSFLLDTNANITDVSLLSRALWEDRGSFFMLCTRGYLPGSALLLLAMFKSLPTRPARRLAQVCYFLDDLYLRLYLVGSNRDRQVLGLTYRSIVNHSIQLEDGDKSFCDPQDSQAVFQAFSGLLLAFQQDKSNAQTLPVDIAMLLCEFAVTVVGVDEPVTFKGASEVLYHAFQYLWLMFDCRGDIPISLQGRIRMFSGQLFKFVGALYADCETDQRRPAHFARFFARVEIVSLTGRLLLMTTQPGIEFQDNMMLEKFIESVLGVIQVIHECKTAVPELFHEAKADWHKVGDYLSVLVMKLAGTLSQPALQGLGALLKVWSLLGRSLGGTPSTPPRPCAYPRCFPIPEDDIIEARYLCAKCGKAAYCTSRCQSGHWALLTPQSHRLECGLPSEQKI